MNKLVLATALILALLPTFATAGSIKFPKDEPTISLSIPDSWSPKETDGYLACTSPDNVTTLYFQIVGSKKEYEKVISDSIDWLSKEQNVKIDEKSIKNGEAEINGRKWVSVSWDGESKEWGPAAVGFWSGQLSEGKVVVITFWFSKKDSEKSLAAINDTILPSITPIGK